MPEGTRQKIPLSDSEMLTPSPFAFPNRQVTPQDLWRAVWELCGQEQPSECHRGEELGALSSVPLQGGAGTAAEPQESPKGLAQDWMTDFGQQRGSPLPQPPQ